MVDTVYTQKLDSSAPHSIALIKANIEGGVLLRVKDTWYALEPGGDCKAVPYTTGKDGDYVAFDMFGAVIVKPEDIEDFVGLMSSRGKRVYKV